MSKLIKLLNFNNTEDAINIIINGYDVNKKSSLKGLSALHHAVLNDNISVVKLLLENGANPNENINKNSYTSLHITRNSNIIELLLENGAEVNIKDKKNQTPFHYLFAEQTQAINEEDFLYQYSLFIKYGADQDLLLYNGYSILHSAISNQIYCLVPKLIKLKIGFSVNIINIGTPLHLAISYQEEKIIKDLILGGIDINIQREKDKWTPLILASQGNQYEIVEILLKNGANKDLIDFKNKKAIDYSKDERIINLLK